MNRNISEDVVLSLSRKSLYIWGAGIKGRDIQLKLKKYNCVRGFIDNSI